jgi:hypothetical protein
MGKRCFMEKWKFYAMTRGASIARAMVRGRKRNPFAASTAKALFVMSSAA